MPSRSRINRNESPEMTLRMNRRQMIGTAAAFTAAPALAQGARRVLRWTPNADLSQVDPLISTANLLRAHGYMVFDTLYAVDAQGRPQPQMAEGHSVSADGLSWTIRLREGLRFHDGERVRPRDCVASLRRWGARDGLGGTLMASMEAMEEADDRTIRIVLKRPFPLLLDAIGKMAMNVAFMMPERLALTPSTTPIREVVGSGPFRFVPGEWVPGSRAVWEKFQAYIPRQEAPCWPACWRSMSVRAAAAARPTPACARMWKARARPSSRTSGCPRASSSTRSTSSRSRMSATIGCVDGSWSWR